MTLLFLAENCLQLNINVSSENTSIFFLLVKNSFNICAALMTLAFIHSIETASFFCTDGFTYGPLLDKLVDVLSKSRWVESSSKKQAGL